MCVSVCVCFSLCVYVCVCLCIFGSLSVVIGYSALLPSEWMVVWIPVGCHWLLSPVTVGVDGGLDPCRLSLVTQPCYRRNGWWFGSLSVVIGYSALLPSE